LFQKLTENILYLHTKKDWLKHSKQGEDHGMIVTSADLNVSKALLDGFEGSEGFRSIYPGSFSKKMILRQGNIAMILFK
jgi:hypothetical protein